MKNRITWKAIVQIFGLLLIFLLSVKVRSFNFNQPLGRHHEWISAHTLITLKIWEHGGGPDQFHFSPVYTFAEPGNKNNAVLTGVVDEKGDAYYISYPPFGFILPYYAIKMTGAGFSAASLQVFSYLLHLSVATLLFFFIMRVFKKKISKDFFIPAWIAFVLYLFAAGNLWFHSNVYFVDILMQLFFVALLFIYFHIYENDARVTWRPVLALGVITFFSVYTEWLGVFLSFTFFMYCVYSWLIKKNTGYFRVALAVSAGVLLAMLMIFLQYSSINGSEAFINAALAKYNLRSGLSGTEGSEYGFSISNPDSYAYLREHYLKNYDEVIIFMKYLLFAFIPLVVWKPKYFFTGSQLFILAIAFSGLLLHHLVFFNFNAVHDFSTLKSGLFFFLLIVFISERIYSFLVEIHPGLSYGYWITFLLFFGITVYNSVQTYAKVNSLETISYYNYNTGSSVFRYAEPDETVFVNGAITPECMYYAGRNYFFTAGVQEGINNLRDMGRNKGIFFNTVGDKVTEIYRFNSSGDQDLIYSTPSND